MADIVVVPDGVRVSVTATIAIGLAGEVISRGDSIYIKESDSKVYKTGTAFDGFAITEADENDTILYQTPSGRIYLGVELSSGEIYVLSGTAGRIKPCQDGSVGEYTTIVGVGDTTGNLDMSIQGESGHQR